MNREEEIQKAAEDYYNEVKYLSDLSAFPIAAFKAGAEWADRNMIDKACEWLLEHSSFFVTYFDKEFIENIEISDFVKNFRKAMEE